MNIVICYKVKLRSARGYSTHRTAAEQIRRLSSSDIALHRPQDNLRRVQRTADLAAFIVLFYRQQDNLYLQKTADLAALIVPFYKQEGLRELAIGKEP